nr:hypothetical protein [Tanacetum cinerariifolium]
MPPTTVPVVTKHVQSMSSLVTPVRRYGNPASGELSHSSIDPLEGRPCYLLNCNTLIFQATLAEGSI